MEALVLEGSTTGDGRQAPAVLERLLAHGQAAYGLALRLLGSPEAAEDAVQQAYLDALGHLRGGDAPQRERAWFLKVTANAARMQRRAEAARKRREERVPARNPHPTSASGPDGEIAAALRRALEALEERYRLPVTLCCEQGLSHAEAAEVLGMPRTTVTRHVGAGLERLRRDLERGGYAAATAAVAGALVRTAPQAPAGLALRVREAAARAAATARPAAAGAAKGGAIMKLVAGLAVAGAAAGAVAAGLSAKRGTLPAQQKPPAFATPVSDPSARWVKETFVRVKGCGDPLDGPRQGMGANATPGTGIYIEGGGDAYFRKYDPELDRYFTYSGGAIGCLDGPLGRARINTSGYARERSGASSPDGRYIYFTEPDLGGILRVLDTEKGEIRTVLKEVGGSPGMCADSKGTLYIVSYGGFQVVSPDGKVEKRNLEFKEGTQGYALCVVIDEVKNRLYAARRDTHVWYWDLAAGGKYVEVLNIKTCKAPPRPKKCATGPFDGLDLHCPAGLCKFPAPEVKFLYFGGGDDTSFYQLDLEKRYMLRFRPLEGEKGLFGMAEADGKVGKAIEGWCGPPAWFGTDGDFMLGDWKSGGSALYRYKRVK